MDSLNGYVQGTIIKNNLVSILMLILHYVCIFCLTYPKSATVLHILIFKKGAA